MYLDLPPCDNLPDGCMATFSASGPATAVRALRLWHGGAWRWCAVTAWGPGGPAPAQLSPIEESGDGPAVLAWGGEHGLRLAEVDGPDQVAAVAWDLADARQWGEPFLICRPDLQHA